MNDLPDLPATLLSHEEVRPQSFSGRRKSTRLQQYRRKLRRRRNRRVALILVLTTAAASSVVAYKVQHPDFTFQQFVPAETTLDLLGLDRILQNAASTMETTAKRAQDAIEKGIASLDDILNNYTATRGKEKTEKRRVVVEVVEEKVEEIIVKAPEPKAKPPEPVVPVETKQDEDRPALCNVPLSYIVHRRCWRLASKNPVFNLHGLVQDMMQ